MEKVHYAYQILFMQNSRGQSVKKKIAPPSPDMTSKIKVQV